MGKAMDDGSSQQVIDLVTAAEAGKSSSAASTEENSPLQNQQYHSSCSSGMNCIQSSKPWDFPSLSSSFRHGSVIVFGIGNTPAFWVSVAILTIVVIVIQRRKRNHIKSTTLGNRQVQSLEDFEQMKILRSTRERSSAFDFFGMNSSKHSQNQNNNHHHRDRSNSLESYDFGMMNHGGAATAFGGSTSEFFRRERMGSMDVFLSTKQLQVESLNQIQRGQPRKTTTSPQRQKIPNKVIPAQLSSGATDENDEGLLYDEFGLVTLSFHVEYFGPSIKSLTYSTWTPPTSWAEASRRIIPQDIMTKLQRTLKLQLQDSKILVQTPKSSEKWDLEFDTQNVSIRIVPPVEGGVINLYVKGSPREQWMEYTFESAREAAQFQLDLTAYQVLGKTVHHLFEALSLVHRGSMAYNGQEFVLHDARACANTKGDDDKDCPLPSHDGCVAWDDAMRAMSSIPTIRIALERLWLSYPLLGGGSNKSSKKEGSPSHALPDGLLAEEYTSKRLLLGPLDFFRLFVPALPDSAFPQSESSRSRMEQLLSWRKRAARAAVLVRSYTASHRVVNSGWQLSNPREPSGSNNNNPKSLTRRLAFDMTDDNDRRDKSARNEYYEASVSRDVRCFVRPYDYFSTKNDSTRIGGPLSWKGRLVLSPYQAYALVGAQVFKVPEEPDAKHPLHPARDPVEAIPSLSELIAENPHLDFFVTSFFHKGAVSVFCYVRTLPKGIDPQFDNVINRFREGTREHRDQRLHLMIQLGHNFELSYLGSILLRVLSLLFNLTRKGRESPLGLEATRDRTSFPAVRLSSYAETHHFGGSLQTNPNLPPNYMSLTSSFQPQSMPNEISKRLLTTLEGHLSEQILDFTFAIEGQREDELPERALCTTRIVNVDSQSVAADGSQNRLLASSEASISVETVAGDETTQTAIDGTWSDLVATRVPKICEEEEKTSEAGKGAPLDDPNIPESPAPDKLKAVPVKNDSAMGIAVKEVSQLLEGVRIPARGVPSTTEAIANRVFSNTCDDPANQITAIPILDKVNKHDMKRFIHACRFDLREASLRIVETAAWRGRIFPIDTRKCRIELHNGQFFQQGFDRDRNPVFYFRNMCLGPWKQDADAVVSAVLHRLDSSLQHFSRVNPDTKCTLVILMGRPSRKASTDGDDNTQEGSSAQDGEARDDNADENDRESQVDAKFMGATDAVDCCTNPRIDTGERWYNHTDRDLIRTICSLAAAHYPERLSRALVVFGKGKNSYFSTILQGRSAMKHVVSSPWIRQKVKFIRKVSELNQYIDEDQLATIMGGTAPIEPHAFHCP